MEEPNLRTAIAAKLVSELWLLRDDEDTEPETHSVGKNLRQDWQNK